MIPIDQPSRHLMVVINPISGTRAGENTNDIIIAEASKLTWTDESGAAHPYVIDVRLTEHAGHATELAAEAADKGYYGIIACGGDGTVNEAATGVCDRSNIALGIIPLGSGNGLARHLGVPMTIPGAFKVIQEDRILESDYATANGRPFFCTFGVGFDAEVTETFNRLPGRGLKTYVRAMLEEYFHFKASHYTIIANGYRITEDALLVAVCNASQYGNNAYIAPQASIKDGLLDVTVIHHGNLIENTLSAIEILTGLVGKSANSTTFRTKSLKIIRNSDGAVHFDGEAAQLENEIHVECHPGQLRLFSTEKKSKLHAIMAPDIPFISPFALTVRDLRFKLYNLFNQ